MGLIKRDKMQSDEIGKLILALSKAQGEIEGANKSADNPFFKSKYADLHECIQAARAPLAKNELAVVQTLEPAESGINIVTILGHSSGQWIKSIINMTPKKDDDQGRGSSITYGRRYSFAAIVGLAQKDDDGNASCGNKKQTTQDSVDKRFSKAIDWITSQINEGIDVDEFDLRMDKMRDNLSIFTGKMKKDIDVAITDTRKAIESSNK